MATNKYLEANSPMTVPVSVVAAAIVSGAPFMIQGQNRSVDGDPRGYAAVANISVLDLAGTARTQISADCQGAFNLPVLAVSALSPAVNSAVQYGDMLYADINTGTYDATLGLWWGFTLSKNQSGAEYGMALGAVPAGTTATIPVLLNQGF